MRGVKQLIEFINLSNFCIKTIQETIDFKHAIANTNEKEKNMETQYDFRGDKSTFIHSFVQTRMMCLKTIHINELGNNAIK